MPWASSVLPHDIVVPWGAERNFKKIPWVAHRVIRHIDHIKADSKYSHTRKLKPLLSSQDVVESYKKVRAGKTLTEVVRQPMLHSAESEYCELWEIHDRVTGKIYVIATGYDKFLRNDTDVLMINSRLPFVDFSFTPQARAFWTTPDAFYLIPHQATLSDMAVQASKQRRASVLKFLVSRGKMKEEELVKLLSHKVGAVSFVDDDDDVRKAIHEFTPMNNNMLLMQEMEYVRRSARESLGLSRNQLGEFEASGRRTATESAIVQENASMRLSRRQTTLKSVYSECFRIINSFIFNFWKLPTSTKVVGPNGIEEWKRFTGNDLQGEYRYDVSFTNEVEMSAQQKQMQAIQVAQILAGAGLAGPEELAPYIRNQFNDPNVSKIINNTLTQQAQQPQQPQQGQNPNASLPI
jgi:hypothetical protein